MLRLHLLQDSHGALHPVAFLAGADQRIVRAEVSSSSPVLHLTKHLQRLRQPAPLFAGADDCIVGDDVGHQALHAKQVKRHLRIPASGLAALSNAPNRTKRTGASPNVETREGGATVLWLPFRTTQKKVPSQNAHN